MVIARLVPSTKMTCLPGGWLGRGRSLGPVNGDWNKTVLVRRQDRSVDFSFGFFATLRGFSSPAERTGSGTLEDPRQGL
jgi:hypothetical protein